MSKQLSNILTEAGTNEVEVLVFRLNKGLYGVNVAKVREIITKVPLTSLPNAHDAVRGVFKLRDHVHPLVDLRKFFGMPPSDDETNSRVIVTEFNSERMGFLVDHVDRIYRVSWSEMSEVPSVNTSEDTALTSILRVDDRMILMLDFERVAFRIAGINDLEDAAPEAEGVNRSLVKVLLADDSAVMRRMLSSSMTNAGFKDIKVATEGEMAWTTLLEMLEAGSLPDVVVTDIEMPKMDGLHLTKRIKEHPQLNHIPVIVFSSLVSDDNLKKCKSVGADRQLTKPELPGLVNIIDELLGKRVPA
ncbi:MAG TPA: chemotaxis protein [Phycisphaerae bacterium]|nr:chemotaxis protein [Phycisphaerae bacterium]